MGKLGKKARKFAKKNLQSVLRNRRKNKALFKRKSRKDSRGDTHEEVEKKTVLLSYGRRTDFERVCDISLDMVFDGNDLLDVEALSGSDGYLSEDSSNAHFEETDATRPVEDEVAGRLYSSQNGKILAKLHKQKEKLEKLRKKDVKFNKLLEKLNVVDEFHEDIRNRDEGESSDEAEEDESEHSKAKVRLLTDEIMNTWYQKVKEENNVALLTSILNAYRAACHYGTEAVVYRIESGETFHKILLFTLSSAADLFKGLLQLLSSKIGKEALVELNKNSKWKMMKPLVKSFVRSTLFLLNQVTDTNILTFIVKRLRASLMFFVAFPSQIPPLTKVMVHLWATGENMLSSASFYVIRDLVAVFGSVNLETCLSKMFSAFLSHSRVEETKDFKEILSMRNHLVQLCSLDVENMSLKALASLNQLAKLLAWGEETKKKESFSKICSWEYINCLDIWVRFVGENIRDSDIQQLCCLAVQIINGLARLFPGPRYFPLRLRCIEWINYLSISSGNFIPLVSMVLDIFEYKFAKEGKKSQISVNISSVLKLPKQYLKSRTFQDVCFRSAVEQLCTHFSHWSYHISFPDLAAIPLIRLKKICEITTLESQRRILKRLTDQVEQNVDFVQRKRDDVSFSPCDHQSVDSFLQLEKPSLNTSFMQYYKSFIKLAA